MNPYEITYIVRPDLDEEETRATIDGVTSRLEAANAEMLATVPWNPPRRRMAYTIRDYGDGFYVTTVFRLDPQAVKPLENVLKLNERILRFILVQATDMNIQQAQQRLQQQQQAAPRPQPAPLPAPEGQAPDTTEGGAEMPPAVEPEPVAPEEAAPDIPIIDEEVVTTPVAEAVTAEAVPLEE